MKENMQDISDDQLDELWDMVQGVAVFTFMEQFQGARARSKAVKFLEGKGISKQAFGQLMSRGHLELVNAAVSEELKQQQ